MILNKELLYNTIMIDTHCHLNFKSFKKILPEVITRAKDAGIKKIIIPGTDVKTSKRAVEIASQNDLIFAAVGIHPHHAYKIVKREELKENKDEKTVENELQEIEKLLMQEKVVAVGEIGMDRHMYEETVYENYVVDEEFIEIQRQLLKKQIELAKKYRKSLIFHNREAKEDMLNILEGHWDSLFEYKTVFHCCEPDDELLRFAQAHNIYIGVDGDITYFPEKQAFIKKVPLNMLVLETDSPFLLPEPLRTQKKYPNEPQNIAAFIQIIADLKAINVETLQDITTANAEKLFGLPKSATGE